MPVVRKSLSSHEKKRLPGFAFKKTILTQKFPIRLGGKKRRNFKEEIFILRRHEEDESLKKRGLDFKMIATLQFYIESRTDLRFFKGANNLFSSC